MAFDIPKERPLRSSKGEKRHGRSNPQIDPHHARNGAILELPGRLPVRGVETGRIPVFAVLDQF